MRVARVEKGRVEETVTNSRAGTVKARRRAKLAPAEAAMLAALGGLAGIATGLGVGYLLRLAVPGLPVETPVAFVLAGLGVSVLTGLLAGVVPARRAAAFDPIEALRAE